MSGIYFYETGKQIDGSYIGSGRNLYICNMDKVHPNMDVGCMAPGNMGLKVAGANIENTTDILSATRACDFDGTAYLMSETFPIIGTKDYNISMAVYFSDWSTIDSAMTLFSQMSADGADGMKVYLATDETVHMFHRSGGATTLDLSWDVSSLTSGWHIISVIQENGVGQAIVVDGEIKASSSDTSTAVGTPTPLTYTITGISNAKSAEVTCSGNHSRTTGDIVTLTGIHGNEGQTSTLYDLHGMDTLNGKSYKVTVTGLTTFTLDGINSTNFDTWSSGGTVTYNPPIYTCVGAITGGTEGFVGRIDEIVLQYGDAWSTDVSKLLANVLLNNIVILDNNGSIRVISEV